MTTGNMTCISVPYRDSEQALEGYLVVASTAEKLPGVLVVPTWLNVNAGICKRATRLAEEGYAVFVLDLFGVGVRPAPPQPPMSVVGPFLQDRMRFRQRLLAGLAALERRPECEKDNMAAVGYCLGGCGVLELARAAAALKGVVSLHGLLGSPIPAERDSIKAKILVLHGDADPLISLSEVTAFVEEMRAARANWELNTYGDAKHSFTGEGVANGTGPEASLHPQSESRSWQAMLRFLKEVLG